MIPEIYLPPEEVVDDEFYAVQTHKAKLRKKPSCVHAYWTVRCSVCGEILGSDTKPDIIVDIIRVHVEKHVIL